MRTLMRWISLPEQEYMSMEDFEACVPLKV